MEAQKGQGCINLPSGENSPESGSDGRAGQQLSKNKPRAWINISPWSGVLLIMKCFRKWDWCENIWLLFGAFSPVGSEFLPAKVRGRLLQEHRPVAHFSQALNHRLDDLWPLWFLHQNRNICLSSLIFIFTFFFRCWFLHQLNFWKIDKCSLPENRK